MKIKKPGLISLLLLTACSLSALTVNYKKYSSTMPLNLTIIAMQDASGVNSCNFPIRTLTQPQGKIPFTCKKNITYPLYIAWQTCATTAASPNFCSTRVYSTFMQGDLTSCNLRIIGNASQSMLSCSSSLSR